MEGEVKDMEALIKEAMKARVGDFREQADSLTLEGVRRALEKDLGLEEFVLDSHKRFIKECLNECFSAHHDENAKNSAHDTGDIIPSKAEQTKRSGGHKPGEDIELEEQKGGQQSQNETEESFSVGAPSEEMIKEAIEKRASYFKANSQTITSLGARRLLEEDLKLDKNSLDEYKSFINKKLEEVLLSPEIVEPRKVVKERPSKKSSLKKASVKDNSDDENEDSSQSESTSENEEDDEEHIKLKKKPSQQRKTKDNVGLKKRKRSAESKVLSPARKKSAKPEIQNGTDAEDDNSSEDGSQSSAEATVKKKREMPTQVYGKRVEHLKSIIKSCGMSVAPTVYKRAKQVPESKRETFLLKELEEILQKEGLSTNPSEKEIKAVKRKKEKAKELEGIDTSNIITSSRRRSSSNFIIPPKPKIPVESDSEDDEDGDDDDSGSDDDDEDNDDGASGEESNEDAEDESD